MKMISGGRYCEYRGRKLTERASQTDKASGKEYVWLVREPEDTEADYPDALEFRKTVDAFLVKLPRCSVSREWSEDVYGLWHGISVELNAVPEFDDRYRAYTQDSRAGDFGMYGSQYEGWWGVIPVDEVQLTEMVIREKPINVPYSMTNRDVIKYTKISLSTESECAARHD